MNSMQVKRPVAQFEFEIFELLVTEGDLPVDRDEVYKEIFEQAESFKKYQANGVSFLC